MIKIVYSFITLFVFGSVAGQHHLLSDEFNRTCNYYNWQDVSIVEGWNASHLEAADVNMSNPGQLMMMPFTTAWYADYRSNLLYKEVIGDFVFSIDVTAFNRAEDGNLPSSQYSLAGTMIRTPTGITSPSEWTIDMENYVFLSVGTSHGVVPQFERKSTTNGNSVLNLITIDTTSAIIKLIKKGPAIVVLYRLPGQSFQVLHRYSRPDMPDTLQVGLVSYTDWQKVNTYDEFFHNANTLNSHLNPDPSSNPNLPFNPDIIAKYQYARFEELNLPPPYDTLDFRLPQQVSNTELLTLFGFESASTDLQGWNIWNGTTDEWSDGDNWSMGAVPTIGDSVLIPNCNCPEVISPHINDGNSYEVASLIVEQGGQLTIGSTSQLTLDLIGVNSRIINEGNILCNGQLYANNVSGRIIRNSGVIECSVSALCNFLE